MNQRQLMIAGIVAVVAAAAYSSAFAVAPGERVALFQLGRLVGVDYAPGLHFKAPFFQSVSRVDGRTRTLSKQSEDCVTHDEKNVRVDYAVKWQVADTMAYYRTTGGETLSAENHLKSMVERGLHEELSKRELPQIVAGGSSEIVSAVLKSAAPRAREIGVELVDVLLLEVALPEEVRTSYYDRMRAERARVAAERRGKGGEEAERIRADADREAAAATASAYRDAAKLRGEGDARAAEIYAKAYGQDPAFFSFYRSLDVYRESFHGQQDVLVLEPKGEFFRYFKQPGAKGE